MTGIQTHFICIVVIWFSTVLDVPCRITSMTSTEIQCITAPKPENLTSYFCGK